MTTLPTNECSDTLALDCTAVIDVEARAGAKSQPRFAIDAYSGGPINVGWSRPVVIDVAGLRATPRVPILLDHNAAAIVGQSTQTEISNGRIALAGIITGDADNVAEPAGKVVSHARRGFQWAASVGVGIEKMESIAEGASTKVNGREFQGPLYVVRAGRLAEVSFVGSGADESASARIAAQRAGGSTVETNNTDRAAAIVEGFGARLSASVIASAIRECWSDDKLEIEALRAEKRASELEARRQSSPKTFAIVRGDGSTDAPDRAALCSAALRLFGRPDLAATVYGEPAARRAESLGCRNAIDLMRCSLQLSSREVPTGDDAIIRASASGVSTYDVSSIVSDSLNKIALDAFNLARPTWPAFSKVVPLVNFKVGKVVRLHAVGGFEPLSPGGELQHASARDDGFDLSIDTRGRIFGIDRRDIINDNLMLLPSYAEALGRNGARSISDSVWAMIVANADSFFSTDHANLYTGTESELCIDSLAVAIQKMRRQTDPDGNVLDIVPRVLCVPPELESRGRQILNSTLLARDTSSVDNQPQGNPFAGLQLSLEVEARITSTTAWYLFAAPSDAPILTGFLNGQMRPVIQSEPMEFNRLGLYFRGYLDYGCAFGEYRAAVAATGTT